MHLNISDLFAEVHHATDKGELIVRVGFPKSGMWWNGWRVSQSPKYPEKGLWIQPPAMRAGNRWMKVLEFSNDSEVLGYVKDEINRAVDRWNREKGILAQGVELEGDDAEEAKNVFPD